MSDPKSWTDERPELLVERLVSAARTERPSADSLTRTLAGVGIAAAATSAATSAAATSGVIASGVSGVAAAKATSLAFGGVLKWTLLAATVAGGTGVVVSRVGQRAPAPPAATSAYAVAPKAPSSPVAPAPRLAPVEVVEVASAPKPSPKPRSLPSVRAERNEAPAAVDAERLAEEVRSIDAARLHVSSGRAAAALALLDDYEKTFPKPGFAPEALYLRMEALKQLGQSAAARTIAERLARKYPNSPQAPRARQVLGESNP
jgi:TolA-binding protein